MRKSIENWEEIPLAKNEAEVFQLQKRIFSLSKSGKTKQVHRLQKLLLNSYSAKCLAVAKVTEKNAGRNTAGSDGQRSLSKVEKLRMVNMLSLDQRILPVKRVWIPKPGKSEQRPLGIPTMRNRALQALIALALEPEWEAQFSQGMYGFRRGRRAQDAIVSIRSSIQRSPKWVLDADIEKFFDRVNHDTLVEKLNTFPTMKNAIRRILKSGYLDGTAIMDTSMGTPQGGPLSPLLANIVLSELETKLIAAYQSWKLGNGTEFKGEPLIRMYADDFVVLHKNQQVVQRCRDFVAAHLFKLGLNLHPEKTRIVHTLLTESGPSGFDFLGHHFQQFPTGKHAVKPYFKQVFTHITPSKDAINRVYKKVALVIDEMLSSSAGGKVSAKANRSPEELLILRLNPIILGWTNYYRSCNAKQAFSRLDHLIWWKLWKTLRKRHKRRGRTWTVDNYLRTNYGKWRFNCRHSLEGHVLTLRLFSEASIIRHYPIKKGSSFYDGDWTYWATRQGSYPGIPKSICKLLKEQRGLCHKCKISIGHTDKVRILANMGGPAKKQQVYRILVHEHCDTEFRRSNEGAIASPLTLS